MKRIFNHPYTKGVLLVTGGSLIGNVANYIFHLVGGRYLGPSRYGILASLVSLLYIVSVLASVFSMVALRELTKLWAKKEREKFYLLFKPLFAFFLGWGLFLFLIFLVSSPLMSRYLFLKNSYFVPLVGLIGFLAVINSLFGAFQQATLRFKEFSLFNGLASFAKIIFIFLVWYFNFLIFGMLTAIILSASLYLILSVFDFLNLLRHYSIKKKTGAKPSFSAKDFLKKAGFVLAANLGMTGFLTSDTILVKHFFSSWESGLYAGVAVMGRVILFATGPLLLVMMPMLVKRKAKKENFRKIFFLTLFLIMIVSFAFLLIYSFFPKVVISLFYGEKFFEAAPLLSFFALYMLFYTLANIFTVYYIAMEEKRVLFFPLIAAGLQIIFINLFHRNLYQIIKVSIFSAALLLLSFLFKFIRGDRKGNEEI